MNHMIDGDTGSHHFSPNWDGKDEYEPEIKVCCYCPNEAPKEEMVLDHIGENWICNHKWCIEQSMLSDLAHCDEHDYDKISDYYDNLLNNVK